MALPTVAHKFHQPGVYASPDRRDHQKNTSQEHHGADPHHGRQSNVHIGPARSAYGPQLGVEQVKSCHVLVDGQNHQENACIAVHRVGPGRINLDLQIHITVDAQPQECIYRRSHKRNSHKHKQI